MNKVDQYWNDYLLKTKQELTLSGSYYFCENAQAGAPLLELCFKVKKEQLVH